MKKLIGIMLLALLALPASALADNIGYQGIQIPGLKVEGYVGWHKVTATTGEFKITWNEEEVLAAYCTDILSYGVGGQYSVASLSSYDYETYSSLYQAAWIMENYSPSLNSVEDAYHNTEVVTAVQSAIWTLLSGWDLSKVYGSWSQKNYTTALYYQILAEASGVDFSTYQFQHDYYYAQSEKGKQDLLFATPGGGAATPEPGSLLLMGSAMMGALGYLRRRKKTLRPRA